MKYLMTVTYDGKNYFGFQKQKNRPTIQGEIERALETLLKHNVSTVGSGRTDAMVSAYMQTLNFEMNSTIDIKKFIYSMNGILPNDIKVIDLKISNIHARFTEKKKTYLYKMYLCEFQHPLHKNRLILNPQIDLKEMKKFIKLIVGCHDFSGFKSANGADGSTVRKIFKTRLKKHRNRLDFYITGDGFLYKMVRNIVGTMLQIGEHKIELKEIKKVLFVGYKSRYTAPAEFLYLFNIKYKKPKLTTDHATHATKE